MPCYRKECYHPFQHYFKIALILTVMLSLENQNVNWYSLTIYNSKGKTEPIILHQNVEKYEISCKMYVKPSKKTKITF